MPNLVTRPQGQSTGNLAIEVEPGRVLRHDVHVRVFQVAESAVHGRGLVATTDIEPGATIAVWPLLLFPGDDPVWGSGSLIEHYVFELDDGYALILGEGSLLNHHRGHPNCEVDLGDDTATVTAVRAIASGEELTIDYAAGDPDRDFGF